MLYLELAKRNKLLGRGSRLCYVIEKDFLSRLVITSYYADMTKIFLTGK